MKLLHRPVNFAKNCYPDYGTDSSTAKIQLNLQLEYI